MTNSKDSPQTKVVLEIPDALDPVAADQKYANPLRQLLEDHNIGVIVSVKQGNSNTPDEFSRFITLQLTEYEAGIGVVQRFLDESGAPAGTMTRSYNGDGTTRDIFVFVAPDDGKLRLDGSSPKMLEFGTIDEISTLVRSGFYDKEMLMQIFCEEKYAPGELDPDDVSTAINSAFAKWESEKRTWPAVTDCDRLDTVFAALIERGIIALQNAGYTQSDGYGDILDAYETHLNQSSVIGYCFYHGQDLERAVRGKGLMLAFGPVDPKDEETKGAEIGRIVREELERAGFTVEWDGTFSKRMNVPALVWQRR